MLNDAISVQQVNKTVTLVFDHVYLTGARREGGWRPLRHAILTFILKTNNRALLVVMHNVKGYASHLIIKHVFFILFEQVGTYLTVIQNAPLHWSCYR